MPTRRIGGEGKRNMPIVVIPKRRKHKNYVSRRRNPHVIHNLRRCSSDPNFYKSYNRWSTLCLKDGENDFSKVDNDLESLFNKKNITSKLIKELSELEASNKLVYGKLLDAVVLSPYSVRKKQLNRDLKDPENNRKNLALNNVSKAILPKNINDESLSQAPIKIKSQTAIQLAKEKLTASANKFSTNNVSNVGFTNRFNFKKVQTHDSANIPSTSEIKVSNSPEIINNSKQSFDKSSIQVSLKNQLIEEKKPEINLLDLANKRQRCNELARIKQELRESGAKLSGINSINRKMVAKKKSLQQKHMVSNKEVSDETKAKNTVDAVTAAFSSKLTTTNIDIKTTKIDTSLNNIISNMASSITNITPNPNLVTTSQKPPASPSMGATRRKFNEQINIRTFKMDAAKLKNVPPTFAINSIVASLPEKDFIIQKPKEILAECSSNTTNIPTSKIYEEEENSENMTAVIPVLNLSRQKFLQIDKSQIQKPVLLSVTGSKSNTNTTNLLASLQLPPSVSAKVDRIIATGSNNKKFVVGLLKLRKIKKFYLFKA